MASNLESYSSRVNVDYMNWLAVIESVIRAAATCWLNVAPVAERIQQSPNKILKPMGFKILEKVLDSVFSSFGQLLPS